MFKIINKIKNIFKKESLTLSEIIENEIKSLENDLNECVPDTLRYDVTKLHLNIAYMRLAFCKTFNNTGVK
jgi:hypothetical protein